MASVEKEYNWCSTYGSRKFDLKYKVSIPTNTSVKEMVHRIVDENNLPCYVEDDLATDLSKFITVETDRFFDRRATEAVERLLKEDSNYEALVERWSRSYQEEHLCYASPEEPTLEGLFPVMYHALIHSPSLDTMLNLEHTYALAVGELVRGKEEMMSLILKRQTMEMEQAVQNVGVSLTDQDINEMAARHFEETQRVTSDWDSKINALKATQKQEFREWVTKVYEDYKTAGRTPGFMARIRSASEAIPMLEREDWVAQPTRISESFTIHLGSQLKVMHNLRLLSADVLDFCRHMLSKYGVPQPQRLQTAMSLYSNNLCGLVLLVDNRINSYVGIKRDFASVCQQSAELHFPDVEEQLEAIREKSKQATEVRLANLSSDGSSQSSRRSSLSHDHQSSSSPTLQAGDFYITRHSNLSEVHVVFHMVTDDSLRSADITSRHPVILGLRNILRVAHEQDVCTVTLPLLLLHEMSEEMTIPWCLKRAELVFKCVKGFMIEMASLVGEETRTVQFLVPKGISEELFSGLSTMLSSIFRISNPLILKSKS